MKLNPQINTGDWLTPWKFIVLLILATSIVYVYILTLAQTPRSCLNVMQAITALFLIIVFLRQRRVVKSEYSTCIDEDGSYLGMLPALSLGAFIWSFCVPYSFISDDFSHLYHARGPMLNNLWDLLIRGQAETFLRPLGFASIFIDYSLWHQWAPGYHITNLLIHLVGVAGLYLLCKGMNLKSNTATMASVIFAVMPINAEAIAWMGARFDLLSTCLTIWTIVLYLKFRKTGHRWFYFWALVCFSSAVFSKESAYIVPLLLLCIESLMLPSGRRFKPVFGFFCAAAVFFGYRWIALGGIGGYANAAGEPLTFNFGIKTLEGLIFRIPAQSLLGFNWSPPTFSEIGILASFTVSILLIIALLAQSGSLGLKRLLFFLAWIILAVLPAHPLIFIGANLTNSRILYMGSAGVAILISLLLSGIRKTEIRRISCWILVCLFCIAVLFNLNAWKWTSSLSQRLLTEISRLEPSPPPNTVFIFHNMPFTVRGVFNLRVGLQEAIKMTYNREDLKALRQSENSSKIVSALNQENVIHFKWQENGETLIKRME